MGIAKTKLRPTDAIPWHELATAALNNEAAREFTHPLYRYPGSMSPRLARALILALSQPGQMILDPFCGGGTTAVEAIAFGRRAVCSDLNTLACFVTLAKAWPLRGRSVRAFEDWLPTARDILTKKTRRDDVGLVVGRTTYAPKTHSLLLRLRDSATRICDPSARRLSLLITLRVGQLCFNCRSNAPSPNVLRRSFDRMTSVALRQVGAYGESFACWSQGESPSRSLRVICCDAADLPKRLSTEPSDIALVLTSPPYPGVHVLYHRWQVFGRRETALPYCLLGTEDGNYESHYTLGHRYEPENTSYFTRVLKVFRGLRPLLGSSSRIAQVVAFAHPEWQLKRYQQVMTEAGYEELANPRTPDSLISRDVPNRRWYAALSPKQHSAREYLLIHRPRQRK